MQLDRSHSQVSRARRSHPRIHQLTFSPRGGRRPGAGRKPVGEKAGVSHRARSAVTRHLPILVTLKLVRECPSLRRKETLALVHDVFRASRERFGLRLVHFSIQSNHLHALVEAPDAASLSRGMQGLSVRLAKKLNRLWQRAGRVLADRFHSRVLRTPREVRHALAYVLNNARKHGLRLPWVDPCSSGSVFDGWRDIVATASSNASVVAEVVVQARSWLLNVGWKRHGRIRLHEVPGRRG